jgi:hypothetical protein
VNVPTDIDTADLGELHGYPFPVFFSRGGLRRAQKIAERTQRTVGWLAGMFTMPEIPPLFVLEPADWPRAALVPQYGLAHVNRTRIVVGQRPSPFWDLLIETVQPNLTPSASARLLEVYGDPPDLSAFADLLVSHELTHLADRPSHLDPGDHSGWGRHPRVLWFTELFANLGLQGYVEENEPDQLPLLETLYQVTGTTDSPHWPVTGLSGMYEAVAAPDADGTNYCWLEFRLQIVAKQLWQQRGPGALKQLHAALQGPLLTEDEIISVIARVDGDAASRARRWLH